MYFIIFKDVSIDAAIRMWTVLLYIIGDIKSK